ncbi:MAG: hypothetical protein WAN50_04350 [Minisyncoccia bacterium]
MFKHSISISIVGSALAAAMFAGVFPASAQTTTTSAATNGAAAAQKLATIISRSNTEITARIADLNKLAARVQDMKNESDAEKSSIASAVQTNIAGLTALQSKIDADTVVATAKADEATIFSTFRIYALVVPRGAILAAADRITVINGLMQALGAKLQARITADQTDGKDVSALTAALSDMNAKIADATTQAQTAQSGITGLSPDQGNKTVAASNHAALVAARANIKTGTQDLQAARKDITTILKGLKALGSKTTTTTAQ